MDAAEYQRMARERLARLHFSFGFPRWLFDGGETVRVLPFRQLADRPEPLRLECRFFMQLATQVHSDVCVFSRSASGAGFRPFGTLLPYVCYARVDDDAAHGALMSLSTPLKGQFVWGPWPDGTYVGLTQDGVLWEDADFWLERSRRVLREFADGEREDPEADAVRALGDRIDDWALVEMRPRAAR
jgi:hypothetical protein